LDPTSRKWECTKKITTNVVIDAVKEVESKKGKIEKVKENYISLGVNIGHDASTALCINGELISNIAEERLSRSKHDKCEDDVPLQSMKYILNSNSIDLPQVNSVVYNGPGEGHGVDYVLQHQQKFHKIGIRDSKLTYGLHHLMHAYSVYYSFSGKKGTAVVVDNGGDIAYHWHVSRLGQKYNIDNTDAENASIYKIEKNTFETIYKHYHNYFPTIPGNDYRGFSLGALYEMACGVVGVGKDGFSAGKLMGLASYGKKENLFDMTGKPIYRDFIRIDESLYGDFYIPRDKENQNLMQWYNYDLREKDFQTQADFALQVQLQFERAILFLIKKANLLAPNENLYLAGGSFLNSTVNQKIVDSGLFENVHIIPAADDTGISIGCAYYGYWRNFRE
jgi:carbamoyltransferase